jgi:tRNA(Ile)-lysidine synthase TilS/MesJ
MNLLHLFQQHIRESGLFQPADGLLIAISGGVDSVVLTHLCHQSGYQVSLAHMNFNSAAMKVIVMKICKGTGRQEYRSRCLYSG